MRTALVYDRVNKWGGAERVLLALNEIFPNAPLFTSLYDAGEARWAEVFPEVVPSFLQKIPVLNKKHEYLANLMPFAFESFNFSNFDTVISITSESAKGIITGHEVNHICYCLTPTRYLWSGYDDYFSNNFLKTVSNPGVFYLRKWDKNASQRPDKLIAISTEVKNRIKKYYNRNAQIIYPPVEDKFFSYSPENTGDYFLIVSRLVKYKKVDLAIQAFNELGEKLIVVGDGSERDYLKSIASDNIEFRHGISDEELLMIYGKARGYIFPQFEDFGIVAVEAQAMGVPVIAYNKGGSQDIVIEGETGVFFDSQDKKSIISATKRMLNMKFNSVKISESAKRFSKNKFKDQFVKLINNKI